MMMKSLRNEIFCHIGVRMMSMPWRSYSNAAVSQCHGVLTRVLALLALESQAYIEGSHRCVCSLKAPIVLFGDV